MQEYPAISTRIRNLRENAGLSEEYVATKTGLGLDHYCDLELYDDEAFTNVSIAHLAGIAAALDVPLRVLILDDTVSISSRADFAELSSLLANRFRESGLSIDAFGEKIGWDVKDVIIDPEAFWNFTIDGIRDVCRAVGVGWKEVIAAYD